MTERRCVVTLVTVAAMLLGARRASAQNAKSLSGADTSVAKRAVHRLRVLTPDSQPVIYANVSVNGGMPGITNERGEMVLGSNRIRNATVSVRRIGFTPWFGRLDFPDTASVTTVTLTRLAQSLAQTRVTASMSPSSPFVQGFYDRWLDRQKGLLSGTFIGPEELEFRHPDLITSVLRGLNGVTIQKFEPPSSGSGNRFKPAEGGPMQLIAMSSGSPNCPMAIVVDGKQHYPDPVPGTSPPVYVTFLDQVIPVSDVMAIEVYPRGGNMPISLQVDDNRCGVIAFWTGSRH
jgi:hypothetical protein